LWLTNNLLVTENFPNKTEKQENKENFLDGWELWIYNYLKNILERRETHGQKRSSKVGVGDTPGEPGQHGS
jgi:hypothetical protein